MRKRRSILAAHVYSGTGVGRSELPMSATTFHAPSGSFR
jgi:hypothetical protein